jgi:Flp pilus assembly pilin Flp
MRNLTNAVRSFVRDEQGATTAEYGIIVVVVAAIAIAVLGTLDKTLGNLYTSANTKVQAASTFSSSSGS